jgi:hypothetical protein
VTQVQHPNPPDYYGNPVPPTPIRTYTYDINYFDPAYSQNAWGRLTTVQYNVPSTSTVYDRNNRPINFIGDTVTEMYSQLSAAGIHATNDRDGSRIRRGNRDPPRRRGDRFPRCFLQYTASR